MEYKRGFKEVVCRSTGACATADSYVGVEKLRQVKSTNTTQNNQTTKKNKLKTKKNYSFYKKDMGAIGKGEATGNLSVPFLLLMSNIIVMCDVLLWTSSRLSIMCIVLDIKECNPLPLTFSIFYLSSSLPLSHSLA
jgi:hypothetical protein